MSTEKKKAPRFFIILLIILILEIVFVGVVDAKESDLRLQSPSLRVTSARWIPPLTEQEDDYGYILAVAENYGNTARRGMPYLFYGDEEKADHYSLSPDLYYELMNESSDENYDSNEIIPPGTAVPLICPVTERDLANLQELLMDGEKIYLTIPDVWAREQVRCELEIEDAILELE